MRAADAVPSVDARPHLASVLGFVPAAVIFDMDGVLADTEPINEQALAAVLARRGASLTEEEYRGTVGQSNDTSWAWMIERFGLTDTAAVLEQEYECELLPMVSAGVVPSAGVVELVGELRASGIRLAVASSSPRVAVGAVLGALGLTRAFDVVVTGEDVAAGKPSPDIFRLASERLGVTPAECLVIEDSPHGIEAAHRAGMSSVAVKTRYIPRDALRADLVIDSIERLLGTKGGARRHGGCGRSET